MRISDLIEEIISGILTNKLRSGLTILGIVIGIGSVIAMIAIGEGAKGSIESQIQTLGSNLIVIWPGAQRTFSPIAAARGTAQTLTLSDAEAIKKEISGVSGVAPILNRDFQVVFKNKNTRTQIVGTNSDLPQVRNYQIDLGSFFTEDNVKNKSKVAVLGPITRDDLFGEGANPIGQIIKINGINFRVIGVTKTKGGMAISEDDLIFVPITTAQSYFTGNEYVSAIAVSAESPQAIDQVKAEITSLLMSRHNIKNPDSIDFTLFTQEDMLQMASSVTQIMTILLASIAGISLLVGGIGIMNMMFTTVTERTREIGLRKAIGAKNSEITLQFLGESVALTFFGGALGIITMPLLNIYATEDHLVPPACSLPLN
ncbi:ABC transporter permease, partial [Candidatus Parcubacteria bacterium]|nr:ABC transporter permease [Candidatus Parcubacteria bacterium]